MAIYKRVRKDGKSTHWQVVIDVDEGAARRRRRVIGTFPTKRQAEAAERKATIERNEGLLLEKDSTTVAELLDRWLTDKVGTVTSNTLADYRHIVEKHIKPSSLAPLQIRRVTPADIQEQYAAWANAGYSARMIRGCHMRLSQAFDYAIRMKLVLHNPVKNATPPRLPSTPFDYWDADESRRFLEAAERDSLWPLWTLLLREGMRRGEALGLRWRDINWHQGTAHIVQTVIHDKAKRGAILIQPRTKTKAGARTVRLTDSTLETLRLHRARWVERQLAAKTWQDSDLIICTRTGGPINPANIVRNFEAITSAANLRRIKVHELRHTSATLMLLAGVPAKVVSERLGHASIGITLDTYSHVLPSMQADAAAAMDRLLG